MDNGNHHYLTHLVTEMIPFPYSLILIDNHKDDQPPAFEGILSCGGWVLEARKQANLKKDIYIGRNSDIEAALNSLDPNIPVFLSIDKDVLSENEVMTNWDQGDMSLLELTDLVKTIKNRFSIIGCDICGEPEPTSSSQDIKKSMEVNMCLIKLMNTYLR